MKYHMDIENTERFEIKSLLNEVTNELKVSISFESCLNADSNDI